MSLDGARQSVALPQGEHHSFDLNFFDVDMVDIVVTGGTSLGFII
jgi:hypothetical protein